MDPVQNGLNADDVQNRCPADLKDDPLSQGCGQIVDGASVDEEDIPGIKMIRCPLTDGTVRPLRGTQDLHVRVPVGRIVLTLVVHVELQVRPAQVVHRLMGSVQLLNHVSVPPLETILQNVRVYFTKLDRQIPEKRGIRPVNGQIFRKMSGKIVQTV